MTVQLFNDDAYDVMKELHANAVYMVTEDETRLARVAIVTDPPYDMDAQGAGLFGGRGYYKRIMAMGLHNDFDPDIFYKCNPVTVMTFASRNQRFPIEDFLRGMTKFDLDADTQLDPNSMTAADMKTFVDENTKPYFHRVEQLAWRKLNPIPVCNNSYVPDREFFFHAWTHGAHPVGDYEDLLTEIATKVGGKSGFDHPTVKPLQVMRKFMKPLQGQVDLIIDPFMGTGTTGVVAKEMGIRFIGIERDPDVFAIAEQRLANGTNREGDIFHHQQESQLL